LAGEHRHTLFSRGCNGNCTFCAVPSIYGSPVFISPAKAVTQIESLIAHHDIDSFAIEDDNFLFSDTFVFDFCNEIKKRDISIKFRINARLDDISKEKLKSLKDIGLSKITIGLEHINENILRSFGKSLDLEKLYSVK